MIVASLFQRLGLFTICASAASVYGAELQEPLTFETVAQYLASHPGPMTLPGFLAALPPKALSVAGLMYDSASLQGSSLKSPRVIAVSEDNSFTVAFNGGDEARGDTIEMMAYRPDDKSLELRELTFSASGATLSAANPVLCQGCHGADPKPIWGTYPVWKGALAEYRLAGENQDSPQLLSATQDFYANRTGNPRYAPLATSADEIDQSARNIDLLDLLFEVNEERVARLIMATPYYSSYKYAIFSALMCPDAPATFLPKYLPATLAAQHQSAFTDAMSLDHSQGSFQLFSYLFETRGLSTGSWSSLVTPLDPRSGSRFAITEPGDADVFSSGRLAWHLVHADPDLAGLGATEETFTRIGLTREFSYLAITNCDAIEPKSQASLSQLVATLSPAQIFAQSAATQTQGMTPLAQLQACSVCHAAGGIGPRLPFDNVQTLTARLQGDPKFYPLIVQRTAPSGSTMETSGGVMPPSGAMGSAQRQEFLDFLNALTH